MLILTDAAASSDAVKLLAKNNKKIAFVSGPLVDDINGKVSFSGYKRRTPSEWFKSLMKVLSLNQNTNMKKAMSWRNVSSMREQLQDILLKTEIAAGLLNGY